MRSGLLVPPDSNDKDGVRKLHNQAVEHYVEKSRRGFQWHEKRLLSSSHLVVRFTRSMSILD
jgi:hypothetical protein